MHIFFKAPLGVYFPAKEFEEKFIYISRQGPAVDGKPLYVGKVGKEVSFALLGNIPVEIEAIFEIE